MPAPVEPDADPQLRAGIALRPDRSTGCLLAGTRVLGRARLDICDPAALLALLVGSGANTPASVSVDLGSLLSAALTGEPPTAERIVMVRIVPRPAQDPALSAHPSPIVERVVAHRFTVPGGHDLFGRELHRLDLAAAGALCRRSEIIGAGGIAVLATGSMAQSSHERAVADLLLAAAPDAHISVAGDFGGLGLAAREGTVVLDAALSAIAAALADELSAAVDKHAPSAVLLFARGDGGVVSEATLRSHPVVALAAGQALRLLGAAYLAGRPDCRIVVSGGPSHGRQIGEVRNGLVSVQPYEQTDLGTELVIPTATLSPFAGTPQTEPGVPGEDVGADLGAPLVISDGDPDELAATGAAVSRPTAWLDEITVIDSTAELDAVRRDARERATAIAIANGAAPGSADVVEMSTVAVPYSPAGTIRVRVRVAGSIDRTRLVPG